MRALLWSVSDGPLGLLPQLGLACCSRRGASKRNCVAQRNAGRGSRGTGKETRGGGAGCVRWGIADQRREGGIAATLIRQRRPAERQAVFLPCRSVNCTYYVYEHPHMVFLWEQRRKGDELSADDGDG